MHTVPALGHYRRGAAVYTGDGGPTRPTDAGALLAEREATSGAVTWRGGWETFREPHPGTRSCRAAVIKNVASGGASVDDFGSREPDFRMTLQVLNTIGR
jgi:hypothetical protein